LGRAFFLFEGQLSPDNAFHFQDMLSLLSPPATLRHDGHRHASAGFQLPAHARR